MDYGLGIKHGLRYKTRTKHYGLGIKYRLRYKTRTEHYGLGIKHEEWYKIPPDFLPRDHGASREWYFGASAVTQDGRHWR